MKNYTATTYCGLERIVPLERRTVLGLMAGTATVLAAGPSWAAGDLDYAKGDMVLGKPDAPVTIIEYASMTCPHCATFHQQTFKGLKEKYVDTGKARFVFREFPLDRNAFVASKLARCAGEKRFFPTLDMLFARQASWSREQDPTQQLAKIVRFAGIGREKFEACVANQTLGDEILNRRLEGSEKHEIGSTPSFVINGKTYAGAMSLEEFSEIIDDLLPAS